MLLDEIAKERGLLPQGTEFGIGLTDHREQFVMVCPCLTDVPRKDL